MRFELKINTNLQLGLGLKKLLSWVKTDLRKSNGPQKAWFDLVFLLQI